MAITVLTLSAALIVVGAIVFQFYVNIGSGSSGITNVIIIGGTGNLVRDSSLIVHLILSLIVDPITTTAC
jgi:hypothetical protein